MTTFQTNAQTPLPAVPQGATDRPTRVQAGLWGLLVAFTLTCYWSHRHAFQVGVWTDDSSYAVLSRSFLQGHRYGFINAPHGVDPTRYPFGYPLLLVPFTLVFPHSPEGLSLLSLFSTLACAALLFWAWPGFSRHASYWWGLAVSSLYLLAPMTLSETQMVMSEPSFTLFSLLAILLTGRLIRGKAHWATSLMWGLTLLMTTFIRTIGVVMVLAAFLCVLMARGREAVRPLGLGLVGMAVLLGLLLAFTNVKPPDLLPAEYVHQFSNPEAFGQTQVAAPLLPRVASAIKEYSEQDLRQLVLPLGGGQKEQALGRRLHLPGFGLILGGLFFLTLGVGLWRGLARDGVSPFWLFALLYFGILLVWPWRGVRFLYAIQPEVFFAWLLGVEGIFGGLAALRRARSPSRIGVAAVTVAAVFLLGVSVWKSRPVDDSRNHTGDLAGHTVWIRANTSPNAVILAEQAQTDYLYGDRKTVPLSRVTTEADLEAAITTHRADYILIAPDLVWQDHYTPQYYPHTKQVEAWLHDPALSHQISLVADARPDGIRVYKILP